MDVLDIWSLTRVKLAPDEEELAKLLTNNVRLQVAHKILSSEEQ